MRMGVVAVVAVIVGAVALDQQVIVMRSYWIIYPNVIVRVLPRNGGLCCALY